ncbi:hypothetical protein E4U31_000159, partial [Claviceps sp. LM219 group G6]
SDIDHDDEPNLSREPRVMGAILDIDHLRQLSPDKRLERTVRDVQSQWDNYPRSPALVPLQ